MRRDGQLERTSRSVNKALREVGPASAAARATGSGDSRWARHQRRIMRSDSPTRRAVTVGPRAMADYIPLLGSGLSLEHFNSRLVRGRPCRDYIENEQVSSSR